MGWRFKGRVTKGPYAGSWRVGKAIETIAHQVDELWPSRGRASDGTLGNTAHQNRKSDHNPNIKDGSVRVVTAIDITGGGQDGLDLGFLRERLRTSRDPRIKYVIYNRQIFASYERRHRRAWELGEYTGTNAHETHLHLSVDASKDRYDDPKLWDIGRLDLEPVSSSWPGVLKLGTKHEKVRVARALLQGFGYGDFSSSDLYNPTVEKAVRDFQRDEQIKVDGKWGTQTHGKATDRIGAALRRNGPHPERAQEHRIEVTDWSRVQIARRRAYVLRELTTRYGYPVNATAGIVGNLEAESSIIPSRIQGSRATTPTTAKDAGGNTRTFSATEVMNRVPGKRGPRSGGVGLAQWTYKSRRAGLFEHVYMGVELGAEILYNMDAQIDYLVWELRNRREYSDLDDDLRDPGITLNAASDAFLYGFERPGSLFADGEELPRSDPKVQRTIKARRKFAKAALADST